MEDDLYGRKPQRKTTLTEDSLNERQSKWKTTSMQDDLMGWRPQRWPQKMTTSREDDFKERGLHRKITSIIIYFFYNFSLAKLSSTWAELVTPHPSLVSNNLVNFIFFPSRIAIVWTKINKELWRWISRSPVRKCSEFVSNYFYSE